MQYKMRRNVRILKVAVADGLPAAVMPDDAAESHAFDGDGANHTHRPRINQAADLDDIVGRAADEYAELDFRYISGSWVKVVPIAKDARAVTRKIVAAHRDRGAESRVEEIGN